MISDLIGFGLSTFLLGFVLGGVFCVDKEGQYQGWGYGVQRSNLPNCRCDL